MDAHVNIWPLSSSYPLRFNREHSVGDSSSKCQLPGEFGSFQKILSRAPETQLQSPTSSITQELTWLCKWTALRVSWWQWGHSPVWLMPSSWRRGYFPEHQGLLPLWPGQTKGLDRGKEAGKAATWPKLTPTTILFPSPVNQPGLAPPPHTDRIPRDLRIHQCTRKPPVPGVASRGEGDSSAMISAWRQSKECSRPLPLDLLGNNLPEWLCRVSVQCRHASLCCW